MSFVRRGLRFAYIASVIVAVAMAASSIVGIVAWPAVYPGVEPKMIPVFVGQEALNLVVALPFLLLAMWLARRGALIGLLLWPGALFYVMYDYGYYALGAPFNALFLVYLALITVSAYAAASVVFAIDGDAVARRVAGSVPRRTVGGSLIAVAVVFTLLWGGLSMSVLASGAAVDPVVRAVVTMDLTVQLPALFVGGLLLWRRHALGYVVVPGLLLQAGAYLIGLSAITVLTEVLTATPFDPVAVISGLVVGALCLGLLAPFIRGASTGAASASRGVAPAAQAAETVRAS